MFSSNLFDIEVSINGATRYPNSWMVYFMENPNLKWMKTRGTPTLGNLYMAFMAAMGKPRLWGSTPRELRTDTLPFQVIIPYRVVPSVISWFINPIN